MVDVTPKTRITIKVPIGQIKYISGRTKYTYEQVVENIQAFLEFIREKMTEDLETWIDTFVPKRTGQLRHFLKEWLGGSSITNNILRIQLGTYLPYAADVEGMTTAMVRHAGQTGYVYYPNIFGVRGKVILSDPMAVGSYMTELIEFAERSAQAWIGKAKHMMWS